MNNNLNQPREFDAVLGSQASPLANSVVLGGLEGVKRRLASGVVQHQIAALYQALNYGDAGLELVIQALLHQSGQVRLSAYSLLRQRSEPRAKETVKAYNPYSFFQCQYILGGHIGIHSVAISPDNQTLVSGSGGDRHNRRNTLKTWDLATGAEIYSLEGCHSADINCVAISPDGQRIVSGSADATIVWDLKTGRQICSLKGHSRALFTVFTVALFHPDGKTLLSAGKDGNINLWKLQTGQKIYTLQGHRGNIYALAISPDGHTLISGGDDRTIRIWNLRAERELFTLAGHSNLVRALAISPDGQTLVSGSDQRIKVWNIHSQQQILSFYGHADFVRSIVITPDGRTFISAGDANIKVWNLSCGKKIHSFEGHSDSIRAIALSADGQTLASGSSDGIKVWRI